MIAIGYVFSLGYAALCILLAAILYKLGVPKRITRKVVHILVGFEWVILYHFVGVSLHFLLVCLICLTALYLDYRKNLLPMMSSDGENAPGTVYYALAMTAMAAITLILPEMILPFGIGVFCTSFGDGFAGAVGQCVKKYNPKIFGNKTLFGTLTNLAVSFAVPVIFNSIFGMGLEAWQCLIIAIFSTELELFVGFGLDNIAVTLGVSGLSYLFITLPTAGNYLLPIIITPIIVAFAYKKRALTLGGIFAALFLDLATSLAFGNFGFTLLCVFFCGSILIDKFKKRYKKRNAIEDKFEKRGECRDIVQVAANGFVALLASLFYINGFGEIFIICFAAALAEAFADTAASGLGILSENVFDPFRMRKCTRGESGGMSAIGTLASLIASLVVALASFAFGRINHYGFVAVTLAGFVGALFDSMLGSLVQLKYICPVCGLTVEREEHCGEHTEKLRGISFINNDTVNFLSTLFAALVAALLMLLFK